ncbi:hypothetical protein DL95DRAFT_402614 [Leptodontidium sp. 2 PMI_412]|nr:hypothetical protein DL95DRAFT_402614 [Leptodontidium sp. 2 PMI_412]
MASGIATLLATEKLHASLPPTGTASLYKTFQSLFLIECSTDDATTLQNIQLNAAILEYLSTQGVSRVKQLLQAWHAQKMKGEEKGDGEEMKEGVSEEKVTEEYTAMEILEDVQNYIRDGVNEVCVYFEGQEVEAIVMMEEVGRKVAGILNQGPGWFRPKFICQPREVV